MRESSQYKPGDTVYAAYADLEGKVVVDAATVKRASAAELIVRERVWGFEFSRRVHPAAASPTEAAAVAQLLFRAKVDYDRLRGKLAETDRVIRRAEATLAGYAAEGVA